MKKLNPVFSIFFLCLFTLPVQAQNKFYNFLDLELKAGVNEISLDSLTSSIVIQSYSQNAFESLSFYYQDQWHFLEKDEHTSHDFRSELIVFNTPENFVLIHSNVHQKVTLHMIQSPPVNQIKILNKTKAIPCSKPTYITPQQWRVGLPDPKPGREATAVKHCIIHHAAGSNFNHNYIDVVRNIYLLHTQTNGWDDIGYNYLIAQDGTLFIGRDPQNVADEDNILGAHFCSKNSGTLGTCLLGNYVDTIPTDTTWATLKQLITWKLIKENLSALDSSIHPENGSQFLPNIAGHRDGCSTTCPGDSVYNRIENLRNEIESGINACKMASDEPILAPIFLIQNLNGMISISPANENIHYKFLSLSGQLIHQGEFNEFLNLQGYPAGVYYLSLDINRQILNKLIILSGIY